MFKTIRLKKAVIPLLLVLVTLIGAGLSKSHAEVKNTDETKQDGVPVPVIMYHSVQQDERACGEYVVSLDQVSSDIRYLKENNFTSVFVGDLVRYVNYNGGLPDKPVILTFDDGFYNNYTYLYDLLKKEDFKASVSVVGDFTTNSSESGEPKDPAYSYLSWHDISDMYNSGIFEFCNHTNSMHELGERKGILPRDGESPEAYRYEVKNDISTLQELFRTNCGFMPDVFTYPYGFKDLSAEEAVRACGFEAIMDVEEKPNYIDRDDPQCLFSIHRYNRSGLTDTSSFMNRLLSGYSDS